MPPFKRPVTGVNLKKDNKYIYIIYINKTIKKKCIEI